MRTATLKTLHWQRQQAPDQTSGWKNRSLWFQIFLAFGSMAVAFLARQALSPWLGERQPLLFFVLAGFVATWFSGIWGGIAATISGLFLSWYFFVFPGKAFAPLEPADIIMFVCYLVVCGLAILLVDRLKRMQRTLHHKLDEADTLRVRLQADIEERKRVQIELQAAKLQAELRAGEAAVGQKLLDLLLEHVPEGITIIAGPPDFKVVAQSSQIEELSGLRSEAVIGHPALEGLAQIRLEHPSGNPLSREETPVYRALIKGEVVVNETVRFSDIQGSRRILLVSAVPLRDSTNKICGAIHCWRDISSRRAAEEELARRARKQTAVAELSQRALVETDIQLLLDRAVQLASQTLDVEYVKVLELLPEGQEMLLKAGVGWSSQAVGRMRIPADSSTHAGYTLVSSKPINEKNLPSYLPVIVEDLRKETRFTGSRFLSEEHLVSGMCVVIGGPTQPYGVLAAHSHAPRNFSPTEAAFLQTVANVLGEAIQLRRTERVLQDRQERLRLAQQAAGLGVFEWNLLANHMLWSPELHLLYGVGAGDLDGAPESWQRLIHPEDRPRVEHDLEQAMTSGELAHDFRIRHPSGETRWLFARARVFFDRRGQPVRMVGVNMDITERKHAEEALRISEQRFRIMADASPTMIWMAGSGRHCTWVNKAWLRFTDRTLETQLDQGWRREIHPDDLANWEQAYEKACETGQAYELEYRMQRADGQYRWVLESGVPVQAAQEGCIGSCIDITERKLHTEELEQRVAERTARLQETIHELERFSYSIVHDLRAPLRAMQGFAYLLAEATGDKLNPEATGYVRRIATSANRMDRLIQDMLSYSRMALAELELEPVDLNKLTRDVIESYPQLEMVKDRIRIEGTLPSVWGNPAALTQCISNLLENAIKFVAPGVVPQVRVWSEPANGSARLWVEDNGIGIASEQQAIIFNMFQRLTTRYEGTGIGLSIVRKAVERMHGQCGVESEPGKGSRFWMEFGVVAKASIPPPTTVTTEMEPAVG